VVTGSRDATVRVWHAAEAGAGYTCTSTLNAHTHYVQRVCTTPNNGLASCSNDKHIIEWDLMAATPTRILEGHTDVVSCIAASLSGLLYSASWDKTARVWKEGACLRVLKGHEHALWSILPLDDADDQVLTASADRTIKLWSGEECSHTYTGHTDVVRALANIPNLGFLSASNDGTVRLWELGGSCLSTFQASESFVYAISVLPSGEWMTCSEDRTVRLWGGASGDCLQSITHPSTVWAVKGLPNGDIVAGCADGNAYVWTREDARVAAPADASAFKEQVAAFSLPAQQVADGMLGDLDTKNLPSEDALNTPGTREGQTKIVKDSNTGTTWLYQWAGASNTWEKVGEVTNAKEDEGATLGKRMFEGTEYDYLFDIDINGAMLKLPFNRGDDPYMAAQQWMWRHDLDQGFLDQVASHIMANTPGNVPTAGTGNVDPFTSGGAYRPGPPPGGAVGGGGNVDPFTSGGAYRPGPPPGAGGSSGGGGAGGGRGYEDPVSSKRYRPGDADKGVAPPPQFLLHNACKHDAVLGKLMDFNTQLVAAGAAGAMDEARSARLAALVRTLKDPTMYHATTISSEDVAVFLGDASGDGLLAWPTAQLFPCLDLLRLLVLHPDAAPHLIVSKPPLLPRLIGLLTTAQATPADKPASAAALMLLRTFGNMAAMDALRPLLAPSASAVLDVLSPPLESGATTARLAAVTCLHNLAMLATAADLSAEAQLQMDGVPLQALSLVAHALASVSALVEPAEEESLFRLLLTLNGLVKATAELASTAKDLDLPASLSALALPASAPEKITSGRAAVLAILK